MVLLICLVLAAKLTLAFGQSQPLIFSITNIDILFEAPLANQFLSCLCEQPPSYCTMYGERLEDLKTYRILSVHSTENKATGVSWVHNCATMFGKSDVTVTCTKIAQRVYRNDPALQEKCQAIRSHSTKEGCNTFVGIVWSLMEYSVLRDANIFDVKACKGVFNNNVTRSQVDRAETLDTAILVASIFLGVMFLLMFLAIQYMKPKSTRSTRLA